MILLKDRFILAAGGNTEIQQKKYTKSSEIYDIQMNKWTPLNQLDKPRSNTSMTSINERHVFIFQGLVSP